MATRNTNNTNNTNNNLFGDISNSDILFINILNTMYNDNLRIVHQLMDQNNEIMYSLIDLMNHRRNQNTNTNTNNRHRNRFHQNDNYNTFNPRRIYIDSVPYYLENLQLFSTPINQSSNEDTNTNMERTHWTRTTNNQFSRLLNTFLEPINITPTQTQIQNSTRNIIYGDILDPINNSCPISLETFTDTSNVTMIRHCRHIFNTNSLMSWFNSNCKCPVCRYDIRDYNPNVRQGESNESNESNEETNNHDAAFQNLNQNQNQQTREYYSFNRTNINPTVNLIETIFADTLTDLSNNNIELTIDNTSALLNMLFPPNRRRE
jgi:hypothetical protein